jgi:hypothetical protein
MITTAISLLNTALLLLSFLQANPSLGTSAVRDNAMQTANYAIKYAQDVIASGKNSSGSSISTSVTTATNSTGSSNKSTSSSASQTTTSNTAETQSGGSTQVTTIPVTPPTPVVADAVSFTVERPFSYEVMPMQLNTFSIAVNTQKEVTARISITNKSSNTEVYSKTQVLQPGKNTIEIPVTNPSDWKGGWLSLKVTQNNLVTNYKDITFGRGFIFLTAGQSNSANWECSLCSSVPQSTSGMVSFLADPAITSSSSGFNPSSQSSSLSFVINTTRSPLSDGPNTNVWLSLGEKIVQEYNVPVAFIAVGQGGASIAQWNSNLKPLFSYGRLFPRINGILWHQGETDTIATTPKDTYRDTLLGIIQNIRSDYGYDVPWMIANATFCNASNSYREVTIRQAQQEVVTYGLKAVYPGPDTDAISHTCHFDTLEQLQNYANAWWSSLKVNGLLDVSSSYLKDYLAH